jgi:polyphosphate:AMP phosphotransferase
MDATAELLAQAIGTRKNGFNPVQGTGDLGILRGLEKEKLPGAWKTGFKGKIGELEDRLGHLQREAFENKVPVIIVFEGFSASGKGALMNQMLLALDPRGFTVHKIVDPIPGEHFRPFLWRFWTRLPKDGHIAIFDSSWYRRVLKEHVEGGVKEADLPGAYEEIRVFERQLTDAGAIVVKFFLHISKAEQRARFKKLESNLSTSWRVTKEDWKSNQKYDSYVTAIERAIGETERPRAPWALVPAHDDKLAASRIFETLVHAMETRLAEIRHLRKHPAPTPLLEPLPKAHLLDSLDMTKSISREQYKPQLKHYQSRIQELMHWVYLKRIPVVIVYEGVDAGGKGGSIKRLAQKMDPRGYEVIPIAAPDSVEKAHHYLWRFWLRIPKAGHFAIFDRSWYGRVLVERVEGFATEPEWKRAYQEIREFEQSLLNAGCMVFKFWFHISKEEQLRRFEARQRNPAKQWKITEEDWRNREKWDVHMRAAEEMIQRTSLPEAPWVLLEANSKEYTRIKVLRTVVEALEKRLLQ